MAIRHALGLPQTKIRVMRKRTLGSLGIPVSSIMLGGNVFGWTIDEAKSFAVLDCAADRGFNFIDTADVYSSWMPGRNTARGALAQL